MLDRVMNIIKECEEKTGLYCRVPVKINPRLSRSLGMCRYSCYKNSRTNAITSIVPVAIEFSKKFLDVCTEKELLEVVRHEFAHYYTLVKKGDHCHSDETFVKCCELLGAISSESMVVKNIAKTQYKYTATCSCCGEVVAQKTKKCSVVTESHRYKSSCCKSKIVVRQNY